MRYRVRTYAIGKTEWDTPDVETWFDDPAEAAGMFLNLLEMDGKVPHNTGHRALTHLLQGASSFAAAGEDGYYHIERLP